MGERGTETVDYNPTERGTAGERYEAAVPDTLDLADRMSLAINALTNLWYPGKKWALGFDVWLGYRQAVRFVARAIDAYMAITPKFVEALALCRLGSGNREDLEVDRNVINAQIDLLGADGLTYFPTDAMEGLPEFNTQTFTETYPEGRRLLALSTLCQVDENPQWAEIGKRKVDRLLALSREKEGFRYFWKARFRPGQVVPEDADEPYNRPMPIPDGGFRDWHPEGSMV